MSVEITGSFGDKTTEKIINFLAWFLQVMEIELLILAGWGRGWGGEGNNGHYSERGRTQPHVTTHHQAEVSGAGAEHWVRICPVHVHASLNLFC